MKPDKPKSPARRSRPSLELERSLKAERKPEADGVWRFPAREGFKVYANESGNVCISQENFPGDPQTIVLHPDEARELSGILPAATQMAKARRAN